MQVFWGSSRWRHFPCPKAERSKEAVLEAVVRNDPEVDPRHGDAFRLFLLHLLFFSQPYSHNKNVAYFRDNLPFPPNSCYLSNVHKGQLGLP